ncbi:MULTISPECIES: DHH family phosphoesterase [Carnobacterium]|uniref:DHH family phosphoesterase n=1 Tax=Carnobacterium TaxID=2747 RepID=UPI00289291C0|nr:MULTISPECIES: DHH family phosphoesterase [Carnobacterium]MDT1940724.1 DHH family phosphoesterase [Carnobacterium divergens]MDT1943162.1 DHH family phosphoesterase [Carnobacterium divergens]MDT1948969.1 DHH family phosphoesterase [Carnobacterium divergens]MDT1951450.1 DHH family phosphoesterase [Carnobacterium divergens]MDT1956627.1 DHH family phosphoesterase [Carnobacterium divergens]
MEKKLPHEKLPSFLKDEKLRIATFVLSGLLVLIVILAFFAKFYIGLALSVLFIIVLLLLYYSMKKITVETNKYIADLSYRIKRGEQEALIKMPIGILLYNEKYEVQWTNPYLQLYLGKKEVLGKKIDEIDLELANVIKNNKTKGLSNVRWGDKEFQIIVQDDIKVIYLMDITQYYKIKEQYEEEQLVIGNIFIDNYDEIVQSMNDRSTSNLNNFVTTQLSNWAKEHHIYLKRVSEDRFIVLMYLKSLQKIEEEKFSIIDRVRERTSKQNFPLTLSIGLAYGDKDLSNLANLAQSNLDLALGRGGDQVVVKSSEEDARFYGGKTNPMEKRTRVRSRMISQALQELMKQSDQIFVMGHKYPDMDAIGSCLGIRRIAEMNHKEAWIVVNPDEFSNDISRLMDEVKKDANISKYIITPKEAAEKMTATSLLVMVDMHRPSISIAPELLTLTNQIVVIDHHRRGEEFPENPVLVYIEPYASSAAELITELFEYQSNESDPINKIEATAMLAGIIVDTRSFSLRTGSRTFDAASYLRSCGADSVMIQRLLKENVDTYLLRSHLIQSIEFVKSNLAIATGEEDETYDTVVAAQAADTMLSMADVDASFVITKRADGRVGISARSLGEINVQIIMEALGGGGHLSNAATQVSDTTVAEAKEQLKQVINEQNKEE